MNYFRIWIKSAALWQGQESYVIYDVWKESRTFQSSFGGRRAYVKSAYDTLERVAGVVKARRGDGDVILMVQLMAARRPILLLADFVCR